MMHLFIILDTLPLIAIYEENMEDDLSSSGDTDYEYLGNISEVFIVLPSLSGIRITNFIERIIIIT
jgi:hypothetical protein